MNAREKPGPKYMIPFYLGIQAIEKCYIVQLTV